jgi:hypothetical protein
LGELFASFEEAWSSFLAREEPLESFYDRLPDEDETLAVWLIEGAPAVRAKALAAQESVAELGWLALLPQHFLHVTVHELGVDLPRQAIEQALREGVEAWRAMAPFRIAYQRLSCFHEAVVAEAHTTGTEELRRRLGEDVELHLPHLSLAYFRSAEPPDALRARLMPQRETSLGEQGVHEVKLCLVPISKARILEPWTVAGSVMFSEQR